MNRRWSSKACFKKTKQSAKLMNEVQLGLISTSTLDLIIETSFESPVETKQVQKVDLNWTCFFYSHENRTVRYCTASVHARTGRYDIVSFQILVHFSVPLNFWTCFGTDHLTFFHTHVNATLSVPLFGTDRNGTVRYHTRVNRDINF